MQLVQTYMLLYSNVLTIQQISQSSQIVCLQSASKLSTLLLQIPTPLEEHNELTGVFE